MAKVTYNKNVYYLSISAMQKCIRRADPERAVNFARVAWECDHYLLFRRLWTILYEDCARDTRALLAFYRHKSGYSKFEDLVPLVEAMGRATHCRDVVAASFFIRGMTIDKEKFTRLTLGTKNEKFLTLMQDYSKEAGLDFYNIWDFGIGEDNYDWTIELAERGKSFDWEQFYLGGPYWYMSDIYEESPVSNECEPLTLLNGFYPSEALDGHTMPGKMALTTYFKHRHHEGISDGNLHSLLFENEGWLYRNYAPHSSNIEKLWYDANVREVKNLREYFAKNILPELHKVRQWVIDTRFQADFEELKDKFRAGYVTLG